mgnify:CR=1 FL=1
MTVERRIAHVLEGAADVTIVIHQQPDGDAIGSAVALQLGLRSKSKTARIVCVHDFPAVFKNIVGEIQVETSLPSATDAIVVLDCSELHRTGFGRQLTTLAKSIPIAVIDHHAKGDMVKIAHHTHFDETVAATAEILFDYLSLLRVEITPAIATALLMAIYTDTGGFQHGNTSSKTFSLAGRLVRCGGDLTLVSQSFIRSFNPAKKRLWGKILSSVEIGRFNIVTAIINAEDLREAEATAEDILGLANTLALINEARAALVMMEIAGSWRGVLRTRHANVDVSRIAQLFGGKGQKKAAGFAATKAVFSGKIKR